MKRFLIIVVAGLGVLALPGSAAANNDCSTSTVQQGPVGVQAGEGGLTGTADVAVGACVDTWATGIPTPGSVEGGTVEAGAGVDDEGPTGAYAVADGDDDTSNSLVANYAGVSNYESGSSADGRCDGDDTGSGSNSGGCVWSEILNRGVAAPLVACDTENNGGSAWSEDNQDGCSPDEYSLAG